MYKILLGAVGEQNVFKSMSQRCKQPCVSQQENIINDSKNLAYCVGVYYNHLQFFRAKNMYWTPMSGLSWANDWQARLPLAQAAVR